MQWNCSSFWCSQHPLDVSSRGSREKKRKKKKNTRQSSMESRQGRQNFNNPQCGKYKYIYYQLVMIVSFFLLLLSKSTSLLTLDSWEALGISCYLDNSSSTQGAKKIKHSFFSSGFYQKENHKPNMTFLYQYLTELNRWVLFHHLPLRSETPHRASWHQQPRP